MAPYFQHLGTEQGFLFNADTLQPLTNTDAMSWALELYSQLAALSPYSHNVANMTGAEMFDAGRCLMTLGSVEMFHRYGKGDKGHRLGIMELPGSWYIYDRTVGTLMRCTHTLCPHARMDSVGNIINFAPYNGPNSLVAAINVLAPPSAEKSLLQFVSYLGGRALSFELVSDSEWMDVFRWSHFQVDRWTERGWNYDVALNFINCMSRSFVSGNIALEPRIPSALQLDSALEEAGDRVIATGKTSPIMADLTSDLNARIDDYGRDILLDIYRTSLRLKPLQNVDKQRSWVSGINVWALVLGLCIPFIFLSFVSTWIFRIFKGGASNDRRPIKPPAAGPQTTLVITDIQDSTTLWETLNADIMDEALQLHNQCLRTVLRSNGGYESATEGDSFIIVFHSAYDAVKFCYEAQMALMLIEWPHDIYHASTYSTVSMDEATNDLKYVTAELIDPSPKTTVPNAHMTHDSAISAGRLSKSGEWNNTGDRGVDLELGEEILGMDVTNNTMMTDMDHPTEHQIYLFRGLRVRMGVHTGIVDDCDVIMNEASGRMMYSGIGMAMTKAISDIGHGGQIVISECTYKALTVEKLLDHVHVLHLGEYHLSDALPTTQVYEIVEKELVGRLMYFPALKAEMLMPAWYQAPSGIVCISFTFVVGADTIAQWNGKIFRESLQIYESLAKDALQYYGGYQVEAADGLLLVAFSDAADAIAWGLALHDAMSKADWPKELLTHPLCERLSLHSIDHCGRVHLKDTMGLRLKTGIERGPAKSHPHPTTGYMAYRGKVINRSARITKLASGGQVYVSNDVWEAARTHSLMTELDVQWRSMGTQKLKGVVDLVDVCHVFLGQKDALDQISVDRLSHSMGQSECSSEGEF